MSYILEALRKSEQERQTGQAPSLPIVAAGATPRRPYRLVLPLVLLVLALNGAVLGYFWLHGFNPAQPKTETGVPAAKPHAAVEHGARRSAAVAPPTPAEQPLPSRPKNPAPSRTPPVIAPPPIAPKTAVAEDPPPSARVPQRHNPEPAFATKGASPEITRQNSPSKPNEVASKSELDATPQAASPPAPQRSEQTLSPHDSLPFLEALPADVQQRLPPLKINLFAYSPIPAERFAIIDMKRYNVGERIADGPELVDIRPDSLVLQVGGMRFRVRRP